MTSYVFDNWNLIEEYAGPYAPPPSPTPTATATATATPTATATATATAPPINPCDLGGCEPPPIGLDSPNLGGTEESMSANGMADNTTNTASSATPTAVYLWAGGEMVVNVTMSYYYFHDGRSNVSHLTNASNVLIERYTYDLNGTVTYNGNPSQATSSVGNCFLFAGAILLPETNLYDMRNRMYFPRWGRFLQTDPIGFNGDASNLYRYCGNDPVDRTDPDGLISIDTTWSRLMYFIGSALDSFDKIADIYRNWGSPSMGPNGGGGGGGQAAGVGSGVGRDVTFAGLSKGGQKADKVDSLVDRGTTMLSEEVQSGKTQTGVVLDKPPYRIAPIDENVPLRYPGHPSLGRQSQGREEFKFVAPRSAKFYIVHYHHRGGRSGQLTDNADREMLRKGYPIIFTNRDWAGQGKFQILRPGRAAEWHDDPRIIP